MTPEDLRSLAQETAVIFLLVFFALGFAFCMFLYEMEILTVLKKDAQTEKEEPEE